MQPLEPNNGVGTATGYVKKLEVTFQSEHAPADGPRRPQRRLKLTRCASVAPGSAHRHLHNNNNNTNNEDFNNEPHPAEHNYCLLLETPSSPEFSSQSQDTRYEREEPIRDSAAEIR